MFPKVSLILGGASSGKSAFAEQLVQTCGKPAIYLATARAGDAEMAQRIARHQNSRGPGWRTLDVPLDVARALAQVSPDTVVLLDCVTLWLSNHMAAGHDLDTEQAALLAALSDCAAPVVVVSNEVGLGGVRENALARRFGQAQGGLNSALAAAADLAVFVTAGLPMVLKGVLPK